GADIWEINANESPAFQYSRFNYNLTNFWQPALPFATSDHNPEIIGIDTPDFQDTTYREVQVLGTNDFHGRLLPDGGNAAGAAPFATAVHELESEVDNSIFVAAGDLVGASTFESFIQDDNPTIDALNAMGLEVSAAGNHEFDKGYADFLGRIQGRADWEYIAANVHGPEGGPQLAETYMKTFNEGTADEVKVGFVGAVTEDLLALTNPALMEGVTVSDVVDSVNGAAEELKTEEGADLVVLLVHEGAPTIDCSSPSFTDGNTTFGNIVQNTSSDVDAIISGHTHLAYNCRFPVEEWSDRDVKQRPVVSAGQYGTNLNQLVFKLDEATGDLAAITQDIVATAGVGYAPDAQVAPIVQAAVDHANEVGNDVLGQMDGPFNRAQYASSAGPTENRGGESTLGNQVAEVQRWATDEAGFDTDIAFMNPGGLRKDMQGTANANGGVRDLTYRQAADVQPFANTLVNMQLTGAQIETVLEQQWQRNAQGGVPSRPFLRLGVSQGFTYTYVETPVTVTVPNSAPVNTFKGEVTGMWLDGEPIEPTSTYSVTVNSFLATGGDNFSELAHGADSVDTGTVDLQAMVDYMKQYDTTPLPVDYGQRAVEVTFPNDAPEVYGVGDTISFDVASWAMSAAGDATDDEIQVKLGDTVLGTPAVNNTIGNKPYDNYGTATVSVVVPDDVVGDVAELHLVGADTGTDITVPVAINDGIETIQVLATNDFHGRIPQTAANGEAGAAVLAGAVKQLRQANPDTVFAAAGDLIGASTFDSFVQQDKPTIDALNEAGLDVSAVGNHELDQGYSDLIDRVMAEYDADDNPYGGAEWQYIAANLKMKGTGDPAVPATFVQEFGDLQIGFVGAVTEELPSLVSPDGIADLDVLDIVDSVNEEATALTNDGVDAVVLLIHEGSPGTACAGQNTPGSTWGDIVTGVNADVDAIVSGHTHKAYNCKFPVPAWVSDERAFTERPVVSAGQYGMALNQLELTFDGDELVSIDQALLPLMGPDPDGSGPGLPPALYPVDVPTKQIVDAAVAAASGIGNTVLGQISAPFSRAKYSNGTDNRGSSSTAGNMIAEVQRWATDEAGIGADIAFMNPGGIREDMVGNGTTYPRDLTYRQAANVQSFANSLINMKLTGEQIKKVLEQQWQRTAGGTVPTRSFLRLGVSEGFKYTYKEIADPSGTVPAGTKKGVVTGMWLNGEPIDLQDTYSVTVNSFLSPGGDNFFEFANGTEKTDWGMTDLASMVAYFDEFGSGEDAIAPKYDQRAVAVQFPNGAPASYRRGEHVVFDLEALAMTGSAANVQDVKDTTVQVWLDGAQIGTATVDNTVGSAANNNTTVNNAGKAHVDVTLPAGAVLGANELTIVGTATGTEVVVPITVTPALPTDPVPVATSTSASAAPMVYGTNGSVSVSVTPMTASGAFTVSEGATVLGSGTITNGAGSMSIDGKALSAGTHTLTVSYAGNATHQASQGTVTVTVAKADTSLSANAPTVAYGSDGTVSVSVTPTSASGTVTVSEGGSSLGSGSLSGGSASIGVGKLEPGSHTLSVAYAGDANHKAASTSTTLVVNKVASTTSASTSPGQIAVVTGSATVSVTVTAGNVTPTGTVTMTVGESSVSKTLAAGKASFTVGPYNRAGTRSISVSYSGDAHVTGSSASTSVVVTKADASITASHTPGKVKVDKTEARLVVKVATEGYTADGPVTIDVPGQGTSRVRLDDKGRAVFDLDAFKSTGKKVITISYGGDDRTKAASIEYTIQVVRK
ncbi:MAG: 5'-nucleotidase C-terminal domain-containing protein, partial [Nocardioides sp.]